MNKEIRKIEKQIMNEPRNIVLWVKRATQLKKVGCPDMARHSYNRALWILGIEQECKVCHLTVDTQDGLLGYSKKTGWYLKKCKECIDRE